MFDNIIIVQVVGKALKVFETVLRKQSFRNFVSLSKRHIFFFFFFLSIFVAELELETFGGIFFWKKKKRKWMEDKKSKKKDSLKM